MAINLLILAGTIEATRLAKEISDAGVNAILSYAGRVERVKPQPLPKRVGGFGGVAGLCDYIEGSAITHVIDATHPFAIQMSRNAVDSCAHLKVPLLALSRPPWTVQRGDSWIRVDSISAAVDWLQIPARRVMLAVGRMHIYEFSLQPQHRYLLRLVDPPTSDIPLSNFESIISRGPFTIENDIALLQSHKIELLVSKNSGGTGARSKIDAARYLGLPVIMINRPELNRERQEVEDISEALQWLFHGAQNLGV
ncbi:cobalt-precorrin-6A reductase [Paracoccaceae bacterium]|nr:cobalt-precorrin-6A reductase [Paracoccaceae bacterium]